MSIIFLSYESADQDCAGKLRRGLEAAGYTVWHEPNFPTVRDSSYPYLIENAILGSAAVIVLWSQHAASSAWVKRHLLIAQRFSKPLVVVRLDATELPSMLLSEDLAGEESCDKIVPRLLERLPAPDQRDELLALGEQAAHPHIRERKAAIERAAQMLQRGEHREEALTILEYLARNDLIHSVQEKARGVLQAVTPQPPASPPASTQPADARHCFGVRCKNGHVTTFDRRQVCSQHSEVMRALQRKEIMRGLDELVLTCPQCGVKMAVEVDCEGYG
jgi:hypothetical protein